MHTPTASPNRTVLVIGASRGLGEAIVEEYAARGSHVVGTVRGDAPTPLHEFARMTDRVEIEHVDITEVEGVRALADRLRHRT
ncbi:SDR family NAD(P)-dependent oxidoreductase, partial [Bacillus sp. SIMBA_069]